MAGSWDSTIKQLINIASKDFINWLRPGSLYSQTISGELQNKIITADSLLKITRNDRESLLHIEFQTYGDISMGRRLWEYNALATMQHDIPVNSYVVYLTRKGSFPSSPYQFKDIDGQLVHEFHYITIKLWEIPTDLFLNKVGPGLLPLAPLTQQGGHEGPVDRVIERLLADKQPANKELLSLTYAFASLVFEEAAAQTWLRGRFTMLGDILEDTWAFKELRKKGEEEGLKKGLARGLEEGRAKGLEEGRAKGLAEGKAEGKTEGILQGYQQAFLTLLQTRFPALRPLAQERVPHLTSTEALQQLLLDVSTIQEEEQARHLLLSIPIPKTPEL